MGFYGNITNNFFSGFYFVKLTYSAEEFLAVR